MKIQFYAALILVLLILGAVSNCKAQTPQELQCIARGWQRVVLPVAGLQRVLLWKGPAGSWSKGAIIVMHGGGGQHTNFCVANVPIIEPQVRFTELAIQQGFAVFVLNSSDVVTDNEGRLVGKVWDDEVRNRPNLDLPFIGEILSTVIPQARPAGSREEIFLTGLSSGGYMTVRAATRFDNLVTAFAPVSSGDPYGWNRGVDRNHPSEKMCSVRVSITRQVSRLLSSIRVAPRSGTSEKNHGNPPIPRSSRHFESFTTRTMASTMCRARKRLASS